MNLSDDSPTCDRRSYDENDLVSADAAIFVETRSEGEKWLA